VVTHCEDRDPYGATSELQSLRDLYASAWVDGVFDPRVYDQAEELRWVMGVGRVPFLVHSSQGSWLNRPWFIQAPHWMLGHKGGSRWLGWLGGIAGSTDPSPSPLGRLWAAERFLNRDPDQALKPSWEIEQRWTSLQVRADATGVRASRGHQQGCALCFPNKWVK